MPATRGMGGTRRYSWGVLECKYFLPGIVRLLLLVNVIVIEFIRFRSVQPLTTFTMKVRTTIGCIVNPK